MREYRIRFNKNKGKLGQGSVNHVWRIFDGDKQYLAKHVQIQVPSRGEKDANGVDYNIVCNGKLLWFSDTDTAVIMDSTLYVCT